MESVGEFSGSARADSGRNALASPKSSSFTMLPEGPSGRDHDVGGFEIAMNDAARVGVFQCGGDLRGNLPGLIERKRAARGSALYSTP